MKLPEDPESERALLATLGSAGTLDPGSENADAHRAVLAMFPEMFFITAHKAVCIALKAMYAESLDVNSLSIMAMLEKQGSVGAVKGYTGLVEILNGEEVGHPTVLVERLMDLWRARQMIRLGADAQQRASDRQEPISEVISDIGAQLTNLATGTTGIKIRRGTALLDRIVSGEAFRDATSGGKLAYFGISEMDDAVEAGAGHVVTIGARPGVGKSAMAIQGVWRTAMAGQRPFLVSLEMDEDEIDSRLASWHTLEGYKTFRAGTWTEASAHSLMGEVDTLDRISTWCHASGVPWAKVEAAIRDAVRVNGATSAWIDHALLIQKPNGGKSANDAACWSLLSRSIKRLAQELKICIVVLLQLNRNGAGVEPKLNDLKESGAWEEDANAVWMLWDKNADAEEGVQAEAKDVYVKSAKNRSGPSGWKRLLDFRGAINRFRAIERTTDDPGPSSPPPTGTQGQFWT